jgi:hypothetical protein
LTEFAPRVKKNMSILGVGETKISISALPKNHHHVIQIREKRGAMPPPHAYVAI